MGPSIHVHPSWCPLDQIDVPQMPRIAQKCPSLHVAEDEAMGEVGSSGNQGKDRSTLPDVWTPPSSSCRTSVCRSVSSWFDVKLIADNIMVDPWIHVTRLLNPWSFHLHQTNGWICVSTFVFSAWASLPPQAPPTSNDPLEEGEHGRGWNHNALSDIVMAPLSTHLFWDFSHMAHIDTETSNPTWD
jgi:hypothetical protein